MLHQVFPVARPIPMPSARTAALVEALGAATRTHVLVIGDDTLDLVCGLIRAGCPGVSAMHTRDRLAGITETVVIARTPRPADIVVGIEHAAHVLTPSGQVFVEIGVAPTDSLVRVIVRWLQRQGFGAIHTRDTAGGVVVQATLSAFGPLHVVRREAQA